VVEIKKESTCLGGAANVASNIHSLGGIPVPLGIIGADFEGDRLRDEFRSLGSPIGGLVVDKARPTSIKTRIIAHHQQVCRTDREDKAPLSSVLQSRIVEKFKTSLRTVDAVIVSDYAKGLLSASLLRQTLPLAKAAGKMVCIDPKFRNFSVYKPATIITPNTTEAEHASGISITGTQDLIRAGKRILRRSGIEHLLITRGEEGMALFESNARISHIPTVAQEVFDVTGAGDTVISTLALSLASGLTMLSAAVLSNIAAGIVVGKLGTASASPDELIAAIRKL
jgi:D-beta-D-heptose 7-phosphate kinase/D-beta-D-heptose 1-phosphate adenosyltransferase